MKVRIDAFKVRKESDDEESMRAGVKDAMGELWMLLLEKNRCFAFSMHLIMTFMMTQAR